MCSWMRSWRARSGHSRHRPRALEHQATLSVLQDDLRQLRVFANREPQLGLVRVPRVAILLRHLATPHQTPQCPPRTLQEFPLIKKPRMSPSLLP